MATERERQASPMAMCRSCGEPLIATFSFAGYEFACVACGDLCGWLDPRPAVETPELTARHAALQAEWDEHALPLLKKGDRAAALDWLRSRGPSPRPVGEAGEDG